MSIPDAIRAQAVPSVPHGTWMCCGVRNGQLYLMGTGNGVAALRDFLPDNGCCYCLLSLRLTLQEIPDQARHIFITWRGPDASGFTKVKFNQLFQEALNVLSPNHGQLETVGKTEFTEEIISVKWHPSAGSHVIN